MIPASFVAWMDMAGASVALAQADLVQEPPSAFKNAGWLVTYLLTVFVLCLVAIVIVKVVQGAFRGRGDAEESPGLFSLADLRRMRDAGDLTQAQYERLRNQSLGLTSDELTSDSSLEDAAAAPDGSADADNQPPDDGDKGEDGNEKPEPPDNKT